MGYAIVSGTPKQYENLYRETVSATAFCSGVGIPDFKLGAAECFNIIEGGIGDIADREIIDNDADAIFSDCDICIVRRFVIKLEFVLKTGAAATLHRYSQMAASRFILYDSRNP